MRFPNARILIFAKAPESGRVKTRLIPALGPEGATELHARFLADTVCRIASTGLATVELWCSPDPLKDPFPELAHRYGLFLHRQQGADLGERMHMAASDALRRASAVVLVGTDCPPMDGAYLEHALRSLKGTGAVLGPAQDGGYVLLGIKRAAGELFRDMPWGGGRVAAITRERMERLGWDFVDLPQLWDVDRPEDLVRLYGSDPAS